MGEAPAPNVAANAPIGVFDSGIGGLSVLRALRAELPHENFVYLADSGHAPYGERDDAHVIARSRAVIQYLRAEHRVKALVIACNTATAAAIHLIRAEHPALPIIGVEPALKPAMAASPAGRIGVLATRGTLASAKFQDLLHAQTDPQRFVLQPCDGLADAIERESHTGQVNDIARLCRQYVTPLGPFGPEPDGLSTLVLGCTHYPFAELHLRAVVGPHVQLIDTGPAVARQTRRQLASHGLLTPVNTAGQLCLLSTGDATRLQAAAQHWTGWPQAATAVRID